jgi:hypothetical protein
VQAALTALRRVLTQDLEVDADLIVEAIVPLANQPEHEVVEGPRGN